MGGPVAFATRFSNGDVVCMDVWTNPLPYLIKTKAVLLERNEQVVRNHYQECRGVMELDGVTPMHTDVPLAPLGYGLIVLDFKTRSLMSMQNYTSFDNFSDLEACGLSDREKYESFLAFCDWGMIEMTRRDYALEHEEADLGEVIYQKSAMIENAEEGKKIAEIVKEGLQRRWRGGPRQTTFFRFKIKLPFEYTVFTEFASRGAKDYRSKLKKLGFELDRPAQKLWREWIKEMESREEEDEIRNMENQA